MEDRQYAQDQVRMMAYQFAEMYFTFVDETRKAMDEEAAEKLIRKVLFVRARERAEVMVEKAIAQNVERIPDNIPVVSDVPYVGWVKSLGCNHCPYGVIWRDRIQKHPWFEKYAAMYCDITDTTIAEVFTDAYSHELHQNVVHGDDTCERTYFLSDDVKKGKYTYDPENV